MATRAEKSLPIVEAFDEKQFYLDEFRGHTLLVSVPVEELRQEDDCGRLAAVVRELLHNDTRVLLFVGTAGASRGEDVLRSFQRRFGPLIFRDEIASLFPDREAQSAAFREIAAAVFADPKAATAFLVNLWEALRRGPLFVGVVTGADRADSIAFAQEVATRLRVHKLILVDPEGGVNGTDGKQLSFMDESMLATLLTAGQAEWAGVANRRPTLAAVRAALRGGVASVNLCTLSGFARELFTYEGSGTLFTLADYCKVQRLGIDDFEEVERLIERGQREGLLKLRSSDEVATMLIKGYGATIGAHHLSGVCALIVEPYVAEHAGEVAGLYTITRFKGEGIGGRLIARVIEDARAVGLIYLFACTTEERAGAFFERHGFRRVTVDDVPASKWDSYDAQRKMQLSVFRLDL